MAHVAIIGAGCTGLATAIFLARRGHRVTLVEADEDTPPHDADACVATWRRHGLAQARQPHLLLTRGSRVLQQEAPEALGAFCAAGAHLFTSLGRRVEPTEADATFLVASRRLPMEAALRRIALASGAVEFLPGVQVSGLVVRSVGQDPQVTGLTLEGRGGLQADLVADASGRFSKASEWLEAAGVGRIDEQRQDCNVFYLTGWYRKRPGHGFPSGPMPLIVNAAYGPFTCFPADGDVFGLTLAGSMKDPLRGRLRRPEVFERVMQAIPEFAPWLQDADALGEPLLMARIENRWRGLLTDGRPLVRGLALVGDSAIHTNPTLGRGISLGLVQAQRLAEMLETFDPASADLVLAFEQWRKEMLWIWYETQVAAEQERLGAIDRALQGQARSEPGTPAERFRAALGMVAGEDPAIALKVGRMAHLLVTPAELMADPDLRVAVQRRLEAGGSLLAPLKGPGRAEFEALVG